MGKVQQGILDGFVGKVGTVVGSFWKGKPTMHAYRRTVRDAHTDEQAPIRLRFARITHVASGLEQAIKIGLANAARAHQMTAVNYFIKRNWDVFRLDGEIFDINWKKIIISEGNLFPETVLGSAAEENRVLKVAYDTGLYGNQKSTDKLFLVAYSQETNIAYITWGFRDAAAEVKIQLPAYEVGNECQLYMFSEQDGMFSNSVPAGNEFVLPDE